MMIIAIGLASGILVGIVVWTMMTSRLHLERQLREQERAQAESLRTENERRVQAMIEGALARFQNVSNAALKANGEEFRALNSGELEHILKPLRESVVRYEEEARKSQAKAERLEVQMGEHMKALGTAAETFNRGSTSFVNAITGGNKVAGNWGEAILEQLLADCGLVEGVNYLAQRGSGDSIPDYQVLDAASHKILVIDSKVSWKRYKEMSESEDPAVREAALTDHVSSIRRQIDCLSAKQYPEKLTPPRPGFEYLPFAAMFVPSDAALWEAVKRDPQIPAYAYSKQVALVTPVTLFGFLRLIHEGWSLYNVWQNQEEIAKEAQLLLERIDRLFKSLEDADTAYVKAHEQLKNAMRLASEGGVSVNTSARNILKLRDKTARAALKSHTLTAAESELEA